MLSARVGHRLFDDGCDMPEKSMVTIGDDCVLNSNSSIQCHSLEDGTFKSGRITLGSGCTAGGNALVHYGVVMADGCVVEADSFLMKGTLAGPRETWQGNPARAVRRPARQAR